MFLQLLRAGIDEGELVEQAMRHRMLPLLAYAMADDEIAGCVLHQLRGELVGVLLEPAPQPLSSSVADHVRFDAAKPSMAIQLNEGLR